MGATRGRATPARPLSKNRGSCSWQRGVCQWEGCFAQVPRGDGWKASLGMMADGKDGPDAPGVSGHGHLVGGIHV